MLNSEQRSSPQRPRHAFLDWLLRGSGKRTRASDAILPSPRPIEQERGNHIARRSSPPSSGCSSRRGVRGGWKNLLPDTPSAGGVTTAPVSTCSGSTVSRVDPWASEASMCEASDMVDFGRLVQPSGGHRPRVEDEHCDYGFDNMEPSFTPAATPTDSTNPIDIPLRLDKEEPDSALQEALRQSLGEMELRMSLPSARAARHARRRSYGGDRSQRSSSPCETPMSGNGYRRPTTTNHTHGGLPYIRSPNSKSARREGGVSSAGAASVPSSYWRSGPPTTEGCFFEGPSPVSSGSYRVFEGDFHEPNTPGSYSLHECPVDNHPEDLAGDGSGDEVDGSGSVLMFHLES